MPDDETLDDLKKIALDKMYLEPSMPINQMNVPSLVQISELLPQFDEFEYCGKGGMGIVFQCRQKELDRKIAVKILPDSLSDDLIFKLRFEKEAKIIASLSHPSIIKVHDFGVTNGIMWFSMEFITGGTLAEKMEGYRFSEKSDNSRSLKILHEICSALDFAHLNNILHRDLKPINILLNEGESQVSAIITDFGLAVSSSGESLNTQLTHTGFNIASNAYTAPEMQMSDSISEASIASDQYSLAAIAYQMLTGNKPIGAFQYPSECGDFPAEVDVVIKKALSPDPERRYTKAMCFYSELNESLNSDRNKTPVKQTIPLTKSITTIWSFFGFGILFTLFLAVFLSSGGNNFSLVVEPGSKLYHRAIGLIISGCIMHVAWLAVIYHLWKKQRHLENCPSKSLIFIIVSCVCISNALLIYLAVSD